MLPLVSPATASAAALPAQSSAAAERPTASAGVFGDLIAQLAGKAAPGEGSEMEPGADASRGPARATRPLPAKPKAREAVLDLASVHSLASLPLALSPPAAPAPVDARLRGAFADTAAPGDTHPAETPASHSGEPLNVLPERPHGLPVSEPECAQPSDPGPPVHLPFILTGREANGNTDPPQPARPAAATEIQTVAVDGPQLAIPSGPTDAGQQHPLLDLSATKTEAASRWRPPPNSGVASRSNAVADDFADGTETGPEGLGTPVAQVMSGMKKTEKLIKTAEPAKQNLPTGQAELGPRSETGSTEPVKVFPHAAVQATVAGSSVTASASATAMSDEGTSSRDDYRLRTLEHTHDLVTHHALRLQRSESDTLRVLLKPGDATQISLELRCRNNAVEAEAVLRQGDYGFLSRHWGELQQRLEPLGVHLAALNRGDTLTTGSDRRDHSDRQTAAPNPEEQVVEESGFGGGASRSTIHRSVPVHSYAGWETWA